MKVGITLPQFRPSVEPAMTAARAGEDLGVDGVFVFDHVFAIGQPHRPARSAWPLLGALAAETGRVALGPLVARVSLLPTAVLVHTLESLQRMVGERLITGLGSGDRLSRMENEAVGVPFPPANERLAALADAAAQVRRLGITTWVGGLSPAVRAIAQAEADALNFWAVPPERVAAETEVQVTWGGPAAATVDDTAELLRQVAAAGATWAVCAPPYGQESDPRPAVAVVAEAAASLR